MNPEDIMLNEISQSQKDEHCVIPVIRDTWGVKFIETGSRRAGAGAGEAEWGAGVRGTEFPFRKTKSAGDEWW